MRIAWVVTALLLGLGSAGAARAEDGHPWDGKSFHWQPSPLTIATHTLATAAIVVDILYTLDIKNHPPMREANPILGPHPSDLAIVGYGLGAIAVSTAAWLALPDELRWIPDVLTVAVQVPFIENHRTLGLRMRLPF